MNGDFTSGIAVAMFWRFVAALILMAAAAIGGWELAKYLFYHLHISWI